MIDPTGETNRRARDAEYLGVITAFAPELLGWELDLESLSTIYTPPGRWETAPMKSSLWEAQREGRVGMEEVLDLYMAGLILSGRTPRGGRRDIVAQVAVHGSAEDVRRARRRARTLSEVTGVTVIPALVTAQTGPEAREEAQAGDPVTIIECNPGGEFGTGGTG